MSANREFAALLYEMADLLEMQKVQWKPQAYRRAARSIESMEKDIAKIYKEGKEKGLREIPGVGESIANHIAEWLKTGKVKKFERWRKLIPKGTTELMQVEGLGPSKVKLLMEKLKIRSIAQLKKAAQQGKIGKLRGFGGKTEKNILQAIETHARGQERLPLGVVLPIAEELVQYLKEKTDARKIQYGGSLRRMKETIGDIDILATTKDAKEIMEVFTKMPGVQRVLAKGTTKSMVMLKEGIHVDLRVVLEESYGAALQYFTGNKDHNIALRNIAIKKGHKLSEYGIFRKNSGQRITAKDEEEVYRRLGLRFIPPELREMRGEIEAAKIGKLPVLIELRDLRGDFHLHTKFSDGIASVEEMVQTAKAMGHEYIAITDHSPTIGIVHGLKIEQLREQWKEIDAAAKKYKITVLKGAEVDIHKDGELDYPEEILKKLHLTVCSVHSHFKMPEEEMTERICTALQNRYLDILGHPSSRRLGERDPINANWKKVFKTAADEGKVLEINSQPPRLDLNDIHILAAKAEGAKFCIDTDSHAPGQLRNLRYGIGQARRGWLEKNDVVNTLPYSKLKKVFGRIP